MDDCANPHRAAWKNWYDDNIDPIARKARRELPHWRGYVSIGVAAVVILLAINMANTIVDPFRILMRDIDTESTLNVTLLPLGRVRLLRFQNETETSAHFRRACNELQIGDVHDKVSKTVNATVRYWLPNLIAAHRKIMNDSEVAFAVPKMIDTSDMPHLISGHPPDGCVLSIQLSETEVYDHQQRGSGELKNHTDVVDMINPRVLGRTEDCRYVATQRVVFVDAMIVDTPAVAVHSVPCTRISYRDMRNEVQLLTFRGVDAHMLNVAMEILKSGAVVSAWGVRLQIADEHSKSAQSEPSCDQTTDGGTIHMGL